MANLVPYIHFAGTGQDAVAFYKDVFGGEAEVQSDGERVIHFDFQAGDIHFMGSDGVDGGNCSLVLNCGSDDELRQFYARLVEGGTEVFAPADSGWGAIIAHCTDRFGVTWLLNFDQ